MKIMTMVAIWKKSLKFARYVTSSKGKGLKN